MRLLSRSALFLSVFGSASSGYAAPIAQIGTQGTVEIRESAAVSVLRDAPFRLLISGGSSSAFVVSVAQDRSRVAYVNSMDRTFGAITMVRASSGEGTTQDNEVLSVSVGYVPQSEGLTSGAHQQKIPLVLAQFN